MAQPEKAIIRSIFEPTIALDVIDIHDIETGTYAGAKPKPQTEKKLTGDLAVRYPYITINGYIFQDAEIDDMTIDSTGFIPTISLNVVMSGSGTFVGQAMPKDGDIISVFIRSRNDVFKPIRNDYVITGVNTDGGDPNGRAMNISFSGTLFIPGLYDEDTRSFEGTSFETLKKIATDLKLGFATNENATADSQIWLCPNENVEEWIKHIHGSMWKDDRSYYIIFIDVYYHMNVINVNNQFSDGYEIDTAILDTLMKPSLTDVITEPLEVQQEAEKVFSNIDHFKGGASFIKEYKVTNNSSRISKNHGYKTLVTIFDMNSQSPWEFDIDPMNTEGSGSNKIILKGRPNPSGNLPNTDTWKTQIKKRYLGIQYSKPEHNVHDKYLYAKLFNDRNNLELDKLFITIVVAGINFNVYRGERTPCFFMNENDPQQQQFNREDGVELDDNDMNPTVNNFYTGYYMLSGFKFNYNLINDDEGVRKFSSEYVLKRREWPVP
jgi:hypothetical protein